MNKPPRHRRATEVRKTAIAEAARPVYPSFGSMGYWHLIDEPNLMRLNPIERADWLYDRLQSGRDKLADKKIGPQLLKALATELVAHFGNQGRMPDSLLRSLAMMLELPETFLDDPVPVFSGRLAQGKHADPKTRVAAEKIDADHFKKHGKWLPVNALKTKLQKDRGLKVERATLRKWRAEDGYASFVHRLRRVAEKT